MGEAWTRSRPRATAWILAAASSWAGIWLVGYEVVLVGTTSSVAPWATASPLRSAKKTSKLMSSAEATGGRVEDLRLGAHDGISGHAR